MKLWSSIAIKTGKDFLNTWHCHATGAVSYTHLDVYKRQEKHSDEYREGMLGNSDSFIGAMNYHGASFHAPSLYTAMNELSNHDHSRFLTRTNHVVGRVRELGSEAAERNVNKAVFREAVVMQLSLIHI